MKQKEPEIAPAPASAPGASASLDPAGWADFRRQAHRMLDDLLGSPISAGSKIFGSV